MCMRLIPIFSSFTKLTLLFVQRAVLPPYFCVYSLGRSSTNNSRFLGSLERMTENLRDISSQQKIVTVVTVSFAPP